MIFDPTRTDVHLDPIRCSADLRRNNAQNLHQVAYKLKGKTISAVAVTGGIFLMYLDVVEVTDAFRHIFDTLNAKSIWNVGRDALPSAALAPLVRTFVRCLNGMRPRQHVRIAFDACLRSRGAELNRVTCYFLRIFRALL